MSMSESIHNVFIKINTTTIHNSQSFSSTYLTHHCTSLCMPLENMLLTGDKPHMHCLLQLMVAAKTTAFKASLKGFKQEKI
jgi:hypothetical protein